MLELEILAMTSVLPLLRYRYIKGQGGSGVGWFKHPLLQKGKP